MTADAARQRLRDRQHQVLADLLAGVVPAGFSERGSTLTTQVLTNKRMSAALEAAPELAALPHWRERFGRFAASSAPGCGHVDVERFVRQLADDPGAATRRWLRLHQVHAGSRLLALAPVDGQWNLVVAVGGRVWYLRRRRLTGPENRAGTDQAAASVSATGTATTSEGWGHG